MYTNQYKFKYLEWYSPEEIHNTTLKWQSEIEFIEVEWNFLKELLSDNTLLLLSETDFEKTKKHISKLSGYKTKIADLKKLLEEHRNALEVLIDGVNELQKEKAFKERHVLLELKIQDFNDTYKRIKNDAFDIMKESLKKRKQKTLLSK